MRQSNPKTNNLSRRVIGSKIIYRADSMMAVLVAGGRRRWDNRWLCLPWLQRAVCLSVVALLLSVTKDGISNPTGGEIVSGSATISTSQNTLQIDQQTKIVIIDWKKFDIAHGETTQFNQPGAGALAVNRIGGADPSKILGSLLANGRIVLINGNGILFGPNAKVDVGALIATTSDARNEDIISGKATFDKPGNPTAMIVNQGTINARNGMVGLVAPAVRNDGVIVARLGSVTLGASNVFTVDFTGDGLISFPLDANVVAKAIDANGKPVEALVVNNGRIEGSTVLLTARAAKDLVRNVISMGGTIAANSVSQQGGRIVLSYDDGGAVRSQPQVALDGGNGGVSVTGRVAVAGDKGGAISIKGGRIDLAGAKLDASGATGGGAISIGGDSAESVSVDQASLLAASAVSTGNGGSIYIMSDDTRFAGRAEAKGGRLGGDGGTVETSGHSLDIAGASIDTSAISGVSGSWLLDPDDYIIDAAQAATIQTNLATGSVTVQTTLAGTGGNGDIFVNAPVSWSSVNGLTLSAYRNVAVNANVVNTAGASIALQADNTGIGTGTVSFASGTSVSTSGAVSIFYNPSVNPAGSAVNSASYVAPAENFAPNVTGGGALTAYMLVNSVYDLQNIQNNLSGTYALGRDIDASETATWNGGAGFDPIGDYSSQFGGLLDGNSHTITDMTINRPSSAYVGLIGAVGTGGMVRNVGLIGGNVTGYESTGTLVGLNAGTVAQSYATGAVTGFHHTGGLVGLNYTGGTIVRSYATGAVIGTDSKAGGLAGGNWGTISQSHATGAVSISGGLDTGGVGGLVGAMGNFGPGEVTITQSYATGAVSGYSGVGGLVGGIMNTTTITQSYATGTVSGETYVGGLVGAGDYGSIAQSYATGHVIGLTRVGGLIGDFAFSHATTITQSYWDIQSTGQSNAVAIGSVAGATGLTSAQARTQANYVGWDFAGTWFMTGDTRPFLRSEWSTTIANAHQLQLMAMDLTAHYTLANDIDLGPALAPDANGNYAGVWSAKGFIPVGTILAGSCSGNCFVGEFDGSRHTIRNLMIDRPGEPYVGLIGYVGPGGTVHDIGVVGGRVTGDWMVGGLIGASEGAVSRSYATDAVVGRDAAGGLVGFNGGLVTESYATGDVIATRIRAGGLIGENYNGTVTRSYATGNVSSQDEVGGLVGLGFLNSLVSQSYATGAVNGNFDVGGLVGQVNLEHGSGTVIVQSYATGRVTANTWVGGLLGRDVYYSTTYGATIVQSYWDVETTGQASGVGQGRSSGTSGLNSAQARTQSSYAGWDFAGTWFMTGETRPFLRSEYSTTITNAHQLQLMAMDLGASYTLANDIDMGPALAPDAHGNYPGMWSAAGFVPVGGNETYPCESGCFEGVFSGDGHAIHNLAINRPSEWFVGMFGWIGPSGTVSDVGLIGGSVTGYGSVGPLAGYSQGAAVQRSYATGTVNAVEAAGGLIGVVAYGTVTDSYATGNVSATRIRGGGLVGESYTGIITRSYATGTVNGGEEVGGLVGLNYDHAVTSQSYATGAVNGTIGEIGGLVGQNRNSSITQSYATGAVSGPWSVGGLVGRNYDDGTIVQSYATGATTGGTYVGGLVGWNGGGGFTSSYWNTQTSGRSNGVGSGDGSGVTGLTTAQFTTLPTGFDHAAWGTTVGQYPCLLWQSGCTAVPTITSLTYSVANSSSTYGTLAVLGPATLTGVATGDVANVSPVLGLFDSSDSAVTLSDALNAGSYAVKVTSLSGSAAGNYTIAASGNRDGTLTVNPAPLIVAVNNAARLYGDANPAFSANITGFVLGQDASVLSGLTYSSAATVSSDVGAYAIASSGGTAVNYIIASRTDGTLTINPAPLTVAVNDTSRAYGEPNPAFSATITGFKLGQNASIVTGLTFSTTATQASNVGQYAITSSGGGAQNYYIAGRSDGTLTINPAALTMAVGSTIGAGEATSIVSALSTGNYSVTVANTGGDLLVDSVLSWTTTTNLTLSAAGDLHINADIANSAGAAVALRADSAGTGAGTVVFASGKTVSTSGSVSVYFNPSVNPAGSGVNGSSYVNPTENYAPNITGGGHLTAYMLVNTVYDLQNVQNNLTGTYALGRDIDASQTATWNGGQGFVPIGTGGYFACDMTCFHGVFDGNGHSISDVAINRPTTENVGLFGGNSGLVRNVGLTGGSVTGYEAVGALVGFNAGQITDSHASSAVSGTLWVGGLVGQNAGTISNTYATGTVIGSTALSNGVGGLAGGNSGTISRSYATGSVHGGSWVGGLVGDNSGTLSRSYSAGRVDMVVGAYQVVLGGLVGLNDGTISYTYSIATVGSADGALGGLVAVNHLGTVDHSYASGPISTGPWRGGLVGYDFYWQRGYSAISDSYWDIETSGADAHRGIADALDASGVTGLTTAQARTQSSYVGWDFANDWFMTGDTRPFLRSEWSTTVVNAHQLQLMAMDMTANYTLANDIDLAPALTVDANGHYSGMWGTRGFVPVGYAIIDTASPYEPMGPSFDGSFDGRGHVISNLTINNAPDGGAVGLFAWIGTAGMARDIGLVNVNVLTGDESYAGGLAGENSGVVERAFATGAVTGGHHSLDGGLVGVNRGVIRASYAAGTVTGGDGSSDAGGLVGCSCGALPITITQSHADSVVSVGEQQGYAGGLVGFAMGTITQSYATGTVSGGLNGSGGPPTETGETASAFVGGLVGGAFTATVTDSYATAAVHGGDNTDVGGLIGWNLFQVAIADSYATGHVSGTANANVGGLVGYSNSTNTISQSYWDMDTTGQSTGIGAGNGSGGGGLTTAQARTQSSYTGWDFAGTWFMTGDARPFLRSEWSSTITNTHQLQLMAMDLTANYTLAKDIDLGPDLAADVNGNYAGMWSAAGFVPVAADHFSSGSLFNGSFEGENHTVSNLAIRRQTTIDDTSGYGIGLFGWIGPAAAIRNIGLLDGSVSGTGQVGGLVGLSYGAITNAYFTGSISGSSDSIGGLVGMNYGTIAQSHATGTVSGPDIVGGLTGINLGLINQSYAAGTVHSDGYNGTGGLVGRNYGGTITQSYATGTVIGGYWGVGGLAGENYSGAIAQSYATGAVDSIGNSVGGLVGWGYGGTIGESYATGAVAGGQSTGGLIGNMTDTSLVIRSYATGTVTGSSEVGGLVGHNDGTITQSYATGAVDGADYAGGLVGINGGVIVQSFATGNAYGQFSIGGLVGWNWNGEIADAYARGHVTALSTYGGGLVGDNAGTITHSYATGAVDGEGIFIGGLVGYGTGSIVQSYWDTQSSGLSRGEGTGVTGLTTAEMQSGHLPAGFGHSVWGASAGSYPCLLWQSGCIAAPQITEITYSVADSWSTYGDLPVLGAATLTGVASGDIGNLSPVLGLFDSSDSAVTLSDALNAGSYTVKVTSLTGSAAPSYTIAATGNQDGTLTIDPAPLIVAVNNASRIYGDANPDFSATITGLKLGQDASVLSGLFFLTDATSSSNVGSYGITALGGTAANYYVASTTDGTLNVTARPITVTALSTSRLYGDINPALDYSVTSGMLVNDDTLSGAPATAADQSSNAGDYAIGQGTLAATSNYDITFQRGTLSVLPRPITVTADNLTRVYGDANPVLSYAVTSGNLVGGDALAGALATSAIETSGIGNYAIGQGSLAASSNYALSFQPGMLTVSARPITVAADNVSRLYGDSNPSLGYHLTSGSLVHGDGLSGLLTTAADATSNVGSYAIGQGTLSATANYVLSFAPGTLTINPAPLAVAVNDASRAYGDVNPAFSATIAGFKLGQDASVLSGLTFSTTATPASNMGSYAISSAGGTAANYTIASRTDGTLTVGARPITVTADHLSRAYGDANPPLTYTITSGNLVNGDALSGALVTPATTMSNIGDYAINQGSLAASSNYVLSFQSGILTIVPRAITVTANNLARLYGDANPALTYRITAGNLVNGNRLSGTLATSAVLTSNAGTYAINQGTLAASSNYALTFQSGVLTVYARPITVAANNASRTYGDANPAFSYRISSGTLVNGDTLTGALTTSAVVTSNIGNYAINRGTLAASSNYTLNFQSGMLVVTQRPITVAANDASRVYGDANPSLGFAVTSGSLVNGDALTGGLATSAVLASDIGAYAINRGSLSASSNYNLTFQAGALIVTARPVAVTANDASRAYGEPNPALTYAITSGMLVNGDMLSGALATDAVQTSAVGIYIVSQGTLIASPNYTLSFQPGRLTINPAPLVVAANDASRQYGYSNPDFSATVTGMRLGENAGVLTGLTFWTDATQASPVGTYVIASLGGTATNYIIVARIDGTLTVEPLPVATTQEMAAVVTYLAHTGGEQDAVISPSDLTTQMQDNFQIDNSLQPGNDDYIACLVAGGPQQCSR